MTEDVNTDKARRLYAAWNGRRLEEAEEIVGRSLTIHSGSRSLVRTPRELRQDWARIFRSMPHAWIEIRDLYSSGDVVAIESTMHAQRHSGEQLRVDMCDSLRFLRGRLVSARAYKQSHRPDLGRLLAALRPSIQKRPTDTEEGAATSLAVDRDGPSVSDEPFADRGRAFVHLWGADDGTEDDVDLALKLFATRNARDIEGVVNLVSDRASSICQKGDVLESTRDFRRNLETLFSNWPDARWNVRHIFASHGTVVMEVTVHGTHRTLPGHRKADLIELTRFRDGKLIWARSYTAGLREVMAPLPSIFEDQVPSLSFIVEPLVTASDAPLDVSVPG
jgi:ketosteroid isomerase-like protein